MFFNSTLPLQFLTVSCHCVCLPQEYTHVYISNNIQHILSSLEKYIHIQLNTSYLYKKKRKIWWYQYSATTPPLFPIIPSEELINHPTPPNWGSSSIALQTFSALGCQMIKPNKGAGTYMKKWIHCSLQHCNLHVTCSILQYCVALCSRATKE